jgi:hypothetical protein
MLEMPQDLGAQVVVAPDEEFTQLGARDQLFWWIAIGVSFPPDQ